MNRADPRALEAYGGLIEGVHIAGYTFERACGKLEWLLEQDRWRGVGNGFDDVNAFMASVRLDNLKAVAEQRKRVALRIKQLQPKVSNRAIAKSLGVNRSTVDRDTGANAPPTTRKASNINGGQTRAGANAPPVLTGAVAARTVEAKESKEERQAEKLEARVQREAALGSKQLALPDKNYGVIVADPEWQFEFYSPRGSLNSSPDNHYPTSPLAAIKARDVPSIAADDSVLFLSATVPMLPRTLEVMAAWGASRM
ncbi:hypothetical protein [Bradyrhizobium sp. th.b2]|uniref:hypothetical protein n=1 Tax=Bradyrhizobium sp. th-b2 TaxID=172088 RepID=UPI000419C882|nr:hypothetical protein [Bradyrhizobium sp. th.b2]